MKCPVCAEGMTLFKSKISKGIMICNDCYEEKNEIPDKKEAYYYKERIITEGIILAAGMEDMAVPLKFTEVKADISDMLALVEVTQKFYNNFDKNIEALYLFPLPPGSAVNFFEVKIGDRVISGEIKEKEEAKRIYENAKEEGKKAGLLEQENPSIFNISIANIEPSQEITVNLKYHETIKYENGEYEFVFPMTITPRYKSPFTENFKVPSPEFQNSEESKREVNIFVKLRTGFEIGEIDSPGHLLYISKEEKNLREIQLAGEGEIPNKDFVLKYSPKGEELEKTFTFHRKEGKDGTFMFHITPKFDYGPEELMKKEVIFVLDRSGSMAGEPIKQAKEALKKALGHLRGGDKFNIIAFDDLIDVLAKKSMEFKKENLKKAETFIRSIYSRGGTEILPALKEALKIPESKEHLRQILFLTDGGIWDEEHVLKEIEKERSKARIFTLGIGPSVNRYLLEKMAKSGRGSSQFISKVTEIESSIETISRQTSSPVLSDITIEWDGPEVRDIYPSPIPDLYWGQTLHILGRYRSHGKGKGLLKYNTGQGLYKEEIEIDFPRINPEHSVLETMWARKKIDDLLDKERENPPEKNSIKKEITELSMEYSLVSPYTSLVAIEKGERKEGKNEILKIIVPSLIPEGLNFKRGNNNSNSSYNYVSCLPLIRNNNYNSSSRRSGSFSGIQSKKSSSLSSFINPIADLFSDKSGCTYDVMPGKQMAIGIDCYPNQTADFSHVNLGTDVEISWNKRFSQKVEDVLKWTIGIPLVLCGAAIIIPLILSGLILYLTCRLIKIPCNYIKDKINKFRGVKAEEINLTPPAQPALNSYGLYNQTVKVTYHY